jgi:hypothetical protein
MGGVVLNRVADFFYSVADYATGHALVVTALVTTFLAFSVVLISRSRRLYRKHSPRILYRKHASRIEENDRIIHQEEYSDKGSYTPDVSRDAARPREERELREELEGGFRELRDFRSSRSNLARHRLLERLLESERGPPLDLGSPESEKRYLEVRLRGTAIKPGNDIQVRCTIPREQSLGPFVATALAELQLIPLP